MKIEPDLKLDFDDVLLKPKRSSLSSRSAVDLSRKFTFKHSGVTWKGRPIIAANMVATGTFDMAMTMASVKHKMLVALHKHYDPNDVVRFFRSRVDNRGTRGCVFYTIGTGKKEISKLSQIKQMLGGKFPMWLMIDVANGYQESFYDFIKKCRDAFPEATIAAGNVATPEATEQIILSGADIVKVGIGSGAVCTTRVVAGVGIPQFSAIVDCADAAHGLGGHIISDGGIRCPGDVSKSFGAGADFIMVGSYLAGTDECEGIWIHNSEFYDDPTQPSKHLQFYGMSSADAMQKYAGGVAEYRAPEGKTVRVPYKGPATGQLQNLLGGLASACTYAGAERLKDLSKCATFVRVTKTHNDHFGKSF